MRRILRDATNKQTKDRHKHSRHNNRPRQTGGETWAEAQRDFQQTELTDRSGGLERRDRPKGLWRRELWRIDSKAGLLGATLFSDDIFFKCAF